MSASEKLTFKENGGPAFPSSYNSFASGGSGGGGGGYSNQGMSLRDYLAAQAMQGMIVRGDPNGCVPAWAYEMADAMLEARK